MTPAPPDPALLEWLNAMPDLPGVRPLERLVTSPATRRAAYRRRLPPDEVAAPPPEQQVVSLVREAGVLRWRIGTVSAARAMGRRAGPRAALPGGEVVRQYAFERLPGSDVYTALAALDRTLTPMAPSARDDTSATPRTGLRRWKDGLLVPFPDPGLAAGRKVLLFVHGTFSRSEALLDEGLARAPGGAKLLADAEKQYDLVLAFDHPTLSVSPSLNAFDLAARLRPSPAKLDIVCHSRGGLVARWFCEALADPAVKRRVLFFGSPLGGTSLAAAPRLRSSLDLLSNIADALRTGADLAAANPFFLAAAGLLRVVQAVTSLAAKVPAFDVALALIPGLDAQSRTGNNEEIRRLRANTGGSDFQTGAIRYHAVVADFEPREIGWNFLRLFSKPLHRLGDWGADIVFPDRNDLVVDTSSMPEVADGRAIPIAHDFGTTERVHHLNYFRQPESVKAIRSTFSIS